MTKRESHVVRFASDGRLLSEQRVTIPRAALPIGFQLDTAWVQQLARNYFASVQRTTLNLFRADYRATETSLRFPLIGDVLTFGDESLDREHTQIAWRIVGGVMRVENVARGGQLIIGAQWEQAGDALTLFIRVVDYTSRLIALFGPRPGEIVYHLTQGLSHKILTLRFLREQARHLTNS